MSTTAALTVLCLTWWWGTSTCFVCSLRTSVAWVRMRVWARTRLPSPSPVSGWGCGCSHMMNVYFLVRFDCKMNICKLRHFPFSLVSSLSYLSNQTLSHLLIINFSNNKGFQKINLLDDPFLCWNCFKSYISSIFFKAFDVLRHNFSCTIYFFSKFLNKYSLLNAVSFTHSFSHCLSINVSLCLTLSLPICLSVGLECKCAPFKERDMTCPPKFTTPLVDRSVVMGYSTAISCSVKGFPKARHSHNNILIQLYLYSTYFNNRQCHNADLQKYIKDGYHF